MNLLPEHCPPNWLAFILKHENNRLEGQLCSGCNHPIGRTGRFIRRRTWNNWPVSDFVFHDDYCLELWISCGTLEVHTGPRQRSLHDRLAMKFRAKFTYLHRQGKALGPPPEQFIKSLGFE